MLLNALLKDSLSILIPSEELHNKTTVLAIHVQVTGSFNKEDKSTILDRGIFHTTESFLEAQTWYTYFIKLQDYFYKSTSIVYSSEKVTIYRPTNDSS
jgi:hypothetical protein